MRSARRNYRILLILAWGTVAAAAGPDTPLNVSPPHGAVGVPAEATLCVQATDPDMDSLDLRFFGRDLGADPEADFTIVVIPDSQFYAQRHPEIFHAQTRWIVEQRAARNIVFVSHVGDIVHLANSDWEWSVAEAAMGRLEDPTTTLLGEGIPYGMAVGNHDQYPNEWPGTLASQGSTTVKFNNIFGTSRFEGRTYYGGHFGTNNDNSYQLFSAGGMDFIIIHLEHDKAPQGPSDLRGPVLDWADALLKAHPDRRGIVTSHHLLCASQSCPTTISAPFSEQGQATYDALKDNPNLFLMLAGHAGGSDYQNRRLDVFEGREIHTLMSCYHFGEPCPYLCGNGYLRIMTFRPGSDQIDVKTYSPWLDRYKTTPHNQFVLDVDMNGGRHFTEIASLQDLASGTTSCVPWKALESGAEYEWYVEVSDGQQTTIGPRWRFTDTGACVSTLMCDDGDPCTVDDCVATACVNNPIPQCCVDVGDCDDGNFCTFDACLGGSCSNANRTWACSDGDDCTVNDRCSAGTCAGTTLVCDDGNACTEDLCVAGACQSTFVPVSSCCTQDSDCNDDNPCTLDSCQGVPGCRNTPVAGCCVSHAECNDSIACTSDVCPPRNRGALLIDSLYGHMTAVRPGESALSSSTGPGEFPGMNAKTFTVELWFKWAGGGIVAATSGYPYSSTDVGGIQAYPLVAKGIRDSEAHPNNPFLDGLTSVNYFLGILEPGHVLAADFEEHPRGPHPHQNHPVIGTTVIEPGVWHHAAVTYGRPCWQLYLDGLPETDGANCPNAPPAYETLHYFSVGVGQGWEGLVMGSFLGRIDEVRVWRRVRSQAEIQGSMHAQIVSHPDLLGRFSFDEPGTQAFDTTGNDNAGVIVGAKLETEDLVDLGGGDCVNRAPVEVTDLEARPGISCQYYGCTGPLDSVNLRWPEPSPGVLSYDVVSGTLAELWIDDGANTGACLADDTFGAYFKDARTGPAAGEGYFYLVREQGICDGGTYGQSSAGAERLPQEICP